MALFQKRPLAAACLLLILAVPVAANLSFLWLTVLFCVLAALLIGFFTLYLLRRGSYPVFLAFLLMLGAFLGIARVWTEHLYTRQTVGEALYTEVDAELTVVEVTYRSSYGSEFLVSLDALNGEACELKVVLQTDVLAPFDLGDRIGGRFYCCAVTDIGDSAIYTDYWADGACACLIPMEYDGLFLIESGNGSLRARINDFRYALHNGLSAAVGGEAGELTGALLLGTRDNLGSDTVRDFRRAGLSHLLALSGLHLAILAGILDRTLRLCRLGKRTRIVILVLFLCFYLALTGFSFSMMRAVFMLLLVYASFWVGGDYDAVTALCFGGTVIVLITPGAVFDLSFQMTMLATFGILVFGGLSNRILRLIPSRKGLRGLAPRLARTVISSLSVTLFATLAILPVQWLVFGEISLITPLSNLLMIPLSMPLLALGLLLLCFTAFGIPAWLLAAPVKLLAEIMLRITQTLSVTDCMLSLRYGFVAFIFIPLFVSTAVLLVVRLKKRLQPFVLLPAALSLIAFVICLNISHAIGAEQMTVSYSTTGTSEGLMLVQNGRAVICDLSSGSFTRLRNEYTALQEQCVCEVEVLMLTHYHSKHSAVLANFCSGYRVRALWLPEPRDAEDAQILADILSVALAQDIPVTVYRAGDALTVFGTGRITVSEALYETRSVEPTLRIDVTYGTQTLRYESAAYSEYARVQGIVHTEQAVSHLILGGHGPRPHDAVAVTDVTGLREIWIANDETVIRHDVLPNVSYVICPELRSVVLE